MHVYGLHSTGPGHTAQLSLVCAQAFVEKVRRQLSPHAFADFRQQSADFMKGPVSAATLHERVTALGVANIVPELAALCPDAGAHPIGTSALVDAGLVLMHCCTVLLCAFAAAIRHVPTP